MNIPFAHDTSGCQIIVGDCIETMRMMPAQSVHTCVTSPPYFGLRDYGVDGQIGREESPEAFIRKLVDVFREVHRVLRDDGTLWLNLGDTYVSNTGGGAGDKIGKDGYKRRNRDERKRFTGGDDAGLKPKDLIGIPWRVAFALQADGWYLRQDIIWHKPNPMPESVRDRCTKAHEYIFLLSKGPRYFYDPGAIREPASINTHARRAKDGKVKITKKTAAASFKVKNNASMSAAISGEVLPFRNKRSVWTVGARPYKGAHFATFPPDLVEPCVLAGSPVGGTVLDPFGGSGTTGEVALQAGRRAILCELNPEYAQMARERLARREWKQGGLPI